MVPRVRMQTKELYRRFCIEILVKLSYSWSDIGLWLSKSLSGWLAQQLKLREVNRISRASHAHKYGQMSIVCVYCGT